MKVIAFFENIDKGSLQFYNSYKVGEIERPIELAL